MTDFDKKLIEKAENFHRWDYDKISTLINIADTEEARRRLRQIRRDFYDLLQETI